MTIREEFEGVREANPMWSDYVCLTIVVKGKKYTRESIVKYFKWVHRDEYVGADKQKLIDYLFKLSNSRAGKLDNTN